MYNLKELDKKHIWHPFSQHKSQVRPIPVVKAEGLYYYDEKGNKYLDAISSWWVNLHGHSHPYIAQKVAEQLKKLDHVIFDGFTHEKAVELAARILKHLPGNFSRVFYSDDGSTANEVAIKMALQYWHNKGMRKNKIVAFHNSYHGDTFGSMSISARNVFTNAFAKLLFDVIFIDLPPGGHSENQLQEIISQHDDIAAFIFEPLVQGAGGMNMYEAEELDKLIDICHKNEIICIADEVMTGFGRTGTFFAIDQLKNKPDIICLSKGITGGVMPLGLTACAEFIFEAFLSDDKAKTFFHGHSYTANAVACSAACASLDLMEQEETMAAIKRIENSHLAFIKKVINNKNVKVARSKGTILAIEINSEDETHYLNKVRDKVYPFFIERGILMRPLGNIIYVLPPYCITREELGIVYAAINDFLDTL